MIIRVVNVDYGQKFRSFNKTSILNRNLPCPNESSQYRTLVNKYINESYHILPNGIFTFRYVIGLCRVFAKKHFSYLKAEISPEQLTACVYIYTRRFFLDENDLTLLNDIKAKSSNIKVDIVDEEIELKIYIPFFSDKESPMTKAINEPGSDNIF